MAGSELRRSDGGDLRRPQVVPVRVELPVLGLDLEWRIDRVVQRGVAELALWSTAEQVAEAGHALAALERVCAPAAPATIAAWVDLVAAGVGNPPPDDVVRLRAALVIGVSGDLPRACWTEETRNAFARRGPAAVFFPGDADVDLFVRPIGAALVRKRDVLRRVRDASLAPKPLADQGNVVGPQLPAAERNAIVARFRTMRGEPLESESLVSRETAHHPSSERPARRRPVHMTGERLWDARNARLYGLGMPPLPRPATFEGYGEE